MKYKKIAGDELAKITFGAGETIGFQDYCSVRVYVETTLTCNQDTKTLATAHDMLKNDVLLQLEQSVDEATELFSEYMRSHG